MGKASIDALRERFASSNRRIALCSYSRIHEVFDGLEILLASGQLSSVIFERYLASMASGAEHLNPEMKSLLLVALPIGRSIIELSLGDGVFAAAIPPTYGADESVAEAEALLAEMLGPLGSGYTRAWLPLKTLAARAGLARYGRDNVLRFEGAGSYVRLDAWWVGVDAEDEPWGEPRVLERCASCGICSKACPNGCFSEGRFIIDATRCLTYLNEGPEAFPNWLDPRWHNAAVGCLRCQDACPENRNVAGREVYRRFVLGREAAELVLAGRPIAELPENAAAAVRAAEMAGREELLARNLRALIAAKTKLSRG